MRLAKQTTRSDAYSSAWRTGIGVFSLFNSGQRSTSQRTSIQMEQDGSHIRELNTEVNLNNKEISTCYISSGNETKLQF